MRMMLIGLICLGVSQWSWAAPTTKGQDGEAPKALNIVPWKPTPSHLQAEPLRQAPVLHQVLEPIDKDTLKRELEFHHQTSSPHNKKFIQGAP